MSRTVGQTSGCDKVAEHGGCSSIWRGSLADHWSRLQHIQSGKGGAMSWFATQLGRGQTGEVFCTLGVRTPLKVYKVLGGGGED